MPGLWEAALGGTDTVVEIMVVIAAIGFFCLVMTIPLTIGLLFLLLFLKVAQFACLALAKFFERIAVKGTGKPKTDVEVLELR